MKDVTATYAKACGKHSEKEISTEKYSKSLKKKDSSIVGTPKWADRNRKNQTREDEDSDDEFFRVRKYRFKNYEQLCWIKKIYI